METGFTLCKFEARHLDEAEVLEKKCFSDPWSRRSLEFMVSTFSGIACEDAGGRLVGYGCWIVSSDEGEIANIATHPDFRRCGIGRAMLDAMIADMSDRGVSSVYLEVRASNKAAVALYMSDGFIPVGIRKKYYSAPVEDAVLMKRTV